MPENLKELQKVLEQMQQEPPRQRVLDWLRVIAGARRLATVVGVLVLLGVAGSVIWSQAEKIKELMRPRPVPAAPPASAPMLVPSPALPEKAPEQPRLIPLASAPAEKPPEPPPTYKVGEIFAVASWEYCVNEAIRHKSLDTAGRTVWPGPGSEFLELRLTICNMGGEAAIVPPPRLIGPDDTQYDPTRKAGADASIDGESFAADRHYRRQVVFEVPAGKPYKLALQGGWMSEKRAVVEVAR
jgi:hypothetical protein